jgi:uncharacterized peroxidase-related enzyme
MIRIQPATNPTPKAQEMLGMLKQKLGMVPNMLQTLAHSPAALEFYVAGSGALGGGTLSAKDRERIALLTAKINSCNYCSAAHAAIGKGAGLTANEIDESRSGTASDPRSQAILSFAKAVLSKSGSVSNEDLSAARAAALSDGEIFEIVGAVALNIFTNYVNHVADPVVDF